MGLNIDALSKSSFKWLVLILLLGTLIRVSVLQWGLPNQSHFNPYYCDEYYPILLFQNMDPGNLDFNPRDFRNPTFFYYQIAAALKLSEVMGIVTLTSDKGFYLKNPREMAKIYLVGRSLVMLYSLLCIVLLFFLVKEIYGSGPGLIASFLFSVAPLAIYSSSVQEISTPLCFWIGILLFSAIKSINTKSHKWFMMACAIYGLAMSTKYLAAPLLLVLVYSHFVVTRRLLSTKLLIGGLLSIVGFIFGSPYIIVEIGRFAGEFMDVFGGSGLTNSRIWNFSPGHLGYTLGWPLFLTSLVGLAIGLKRKEHPAIILGSMTFLFLFLYGRATVIVSRYYILPIFFLLPFGSKIIYELMYSVKNGTLIQKGWVSLVVLIIVGPTLAHTASITATLNQKNDPRRLSSDWIKENISPGEILGVLREPYYFSPDVIYMDYHAETRYKLKVREVEPYKILTADLSQEKPWGKEFPNYVFTTNIEYKLMGLSEKEQVELHQRLSKFYSVHKEWKRFPKLAGFSYPMKTFHSLEWMMPYPTVFIWKKNERMTGYAF